MRPFTVILLVYLITSAVSALAEVIYVSKRGFVLTADGTSWNTSFQSLQEALASASAGDEIWVAKGRYVPGNSATDRFNLIEGVSLYGGFRGDEAAINQRDRHANPTVLSGDIDDNDLRDHHGVTRDPSAIRGRNAYTVVHAGQAITSATVLDGFIITSGSADATSGAINSAERSGGGLFLSGDPTMRHVRLVGNQADARGGGLYAEGSASTLENLFVGGNEASNGGGIACYGNSAITLTRTQVQGNEASSNGGGMRLYQSDVTITNTLVSGNKATSGGALHFFDSTSELVHVTVAANLATSGASAGGLHASSSDVTVANCIVWGNTAGAASGGLDQQRRGSTFTFPTTAIEGVSLDPDFLNLVSANGAPHHDGNYHLDPDSPILDAGDNARATAHTLTGDLDGAFRKVDGDGNGTASVDPGCYEVVPEGPLAATGMVTNVSSPGDGDDLIASDSGDRETINVTWLTGFAGAAGASGSFRYRFILEDAQGVPVPLASANGTSSQVDGPHTFTADGNGNASDLRSAALIPATPLHPEATYHVRTLLEENVGTIFPIYRLRSESISASSFRVDHFTGTDPADASKHVLARLDAISLTKRHAIQTADTANRRAFRARVDFTLRRYDGWTFANANDNTTIPVHLRYQLRRTDTHEALPLINTNAAGWAEETVDVAIDRFTPGTPKTPAEASGFHTLSLEVADGTQLDSINATYYVAAEIQHTAFLFRVVGNRLESLSAQLLHFNGNLRFAHNRATIHTITNAPESAIQSQAADSLTTTLNGVEGTLRSAADYAFGPIAFTEVRLEPDGTAYVLDMPAFAPVTPPGLPDEGTLQGLTYRRETMRLDHANGLRAHVTVTLPSGMGWASHPHAMLLESELTFEHTVLNDFLEPLLTALTHAPVGGLYVMEESKPVLLQTDALEWKPQQGTFSLSTTSGKDARYVRQDEYALLDDLGLDPLTTYKKSNEAYFNGATAWTGEATITTDDSNHSAKLHAEITIDDLDNYIAHFPYGLAFGANGGQVTVTDDLSSGALQNLINVRLPYRTSCPGAEICTGAAPADEILSLTPTGNFISLTPDGGLAAEGALANGTGLRWGYRGRVNGQAQFAHETSAFDRAVAVVSGHAISLSAGSLLGTPEVLLQSGLDTTMVGGVEVPVPTTHVRPVTDAYQRGEALHPGMNLRVAGTAGVMTCDSFLGDAVEPLSYPLSLCSRYYVRRGGISGVHEADPAAAAGAPIGMATVYGYPLTLDSYALTFLLNENLESGSSGSMTVPAPIDQTFAFEKLTFDCLGGPAEAAPPQQADQRTLAYWADIDFQPLAFAFQANQEPACGLKFLTVGTKVWAPHLGAVYGTSGMLPNGQFMTAASGEVVGIDSRLSVPNQWTIPGPGDESYHFIPQQNLYFNDEASDGNATRGRLNLMGSLDVAFFQNIPVHIGLTNTEAGHDHPAPLQLTGAWKDSSNRPITAPGYDPGNIGFTGTYSAHFESAAHPPTANHRWLNVIDFTYPLEWTPSTRSFKSRAPITGSIVVLEGEHQVRYLSAEQADIKFGILYDGLPEINLANLGYNLADEATGVLASVENAAGAVVSDALNTGLAQVEKLLADQPEDLLNNAVGGALDHVLGDLHDALLTAWDDAETWADPDGYVAALNQYLCGIIPGANAIRVDQGNGAFAIQTDVSAILRDMAGEVAWDIPNGDFLNATVDGSGLLYQIDQSIAQLENSIRALTTGLEIRNNVAIPLPPIPTLDYEALLPDLDTQGIFSAAEQLSAARALIGELLGAFSPDILANLESQYGNFLDAQFQEIQGYFARIEPAVERLRQNLEEARDALSAIRERLQSDIADRVQGLLQTAQGTATALVESVVNEAKAELIAEIERRTRIDLPFPEWTREEFIAMGKRAVFDQLLAQAVVPDIQAILRDELRSLEDIIVTNMSSLFQQVNEVMRDLITEFVADFDVASVNAFIHELNGIVSGAELQGYAYINGDSLRKLRLDLGAELHIPDDFAFSGYLEAKREESGPHVEVLLGADRVPVSWALADDEATVDVTLRVGFNDNFLPTDAGGSVDLATGEMTFSEFSVTGFTAVCGVGLHENYIGASAVMDFTGYEVDGAFFFGHASSMDPLTAVAGDVAATIGQDVAPFTGGYIAGGGHIPIFGSSCLFKISAGIGAGIWYFDSATPVFGGNLHASVGGEALCLVSIRGDIDLSGSKVGNHFNFRGTGTLRGKAGICPFCTRFRESVTITYENGSWDADY